VVEPEDAEIEEDPKPSLPRNSYGKWDHSQQMGNEAVRELRCKKFKTLRTSLSKFIDLHLNDLSYLLHGETYSLTFDISFKDSLHDAETDCIKAVKC
jgi:hypothetical protein